MDIITMMGVGIIACAVAIVLGCIPLGTLIIVAGAWGYGLFTGLSVVGIKLLIVLTALYLLGEVMEYVCIIIGAKRMGASNAGIAGAIIGGILGAMLGIGVFVIGIIPGVFLGIFFGAYVAEYIMHRDTFKSLKAGLGSVLGRLVAMALKCIVALVMILLLAMKVYPQIIQILRG